MGPGNSPRAAGRVGTRGKCSGILLPIPEIDGPLSRESLEEHLRRRRAVGLAGRPRRADGAGTQGGAGGGEVHVGGQGQLGWLTRPRRPPRRPRPPLPALSPPPPPAPSPSPPPPPL